MAYTTFAQFVGYYVPGQDQSLHLDKGWSAAKPTKKVLGQTASLVIVTQPSVRRSMGIMETPLHITIGANDERLQAVLALNSATAAAHVAKFDAQRERAQQAKQGIELLRTIGELLGTK